MSCVTSWACLASWVCPSSWHQLPSSKILNVCISAASHWPGGTPSQEPVLNPHAHQRCRWSEVVVGKRPSAIISFASCHTSSGTSPRGVGSVSMRPLRGRCSSCRRWGRGSCRRWGGGAAGAWSRGASRLQENRSTSMLCLRATCLLRSQRCLHLYSHMWHECQLTPMSWTLAR